MDKVLVSFSPIFRVQSNCNNRKSTFQMKTELEAREFEKTLEVSFETNNLWFIADRKILYFIFHLANSKMLMHSSATFSKAQLPHSKGGKGLLSLISVQGFNSHFSFFLGLWSWSQPYKHLLGWRESNILESLSYCSHVSLFPSSKAKLHWTLE